MIFVKKVINKTIGILLTVVMLALILPSGIVLTASAYEADTVAVVGETEYASLLDALTAVNADTAATASSETVEIKIVKDCEFNTTTAYNPRAKLRIYGDMSDGVKKTVSLTGYAAGATNTFFYVTGNANTYVTVEDLAFTATGGIPFSVNNYATLYLKNCDVTAGGTGAVCAAKAQNNGNLIIDGGNYTSSSTNTSASVILSCPDNTGGGESVKILGGNFESANGTVVNVQSGDVKIFGGNYIYSGTANKPAVSLTLGNVEIIDGYFETGVGASLCLDATQSTVTTAEDAVTSTMIIHGGTFINKNSSNNNSFAIRPRKGAMTVVYGGEFISNGACMGVGESSNGGWLYVFGGTFKKTATAGYDSLDFNVNSTSQNMKNIYIYSGEFYTAKDEDSNLLKDAVKTSGSVSAKTNLVNPDALTVEQVATTETYGEVQFQLKTTISYDASLDTTKKATVTLPDGIVVGTDSVWRAFNRIACDGSTVALTENFTDTLDVSRNIDLFMDYGSYSADNLTFSGANVTKLVSDTTVFGAECFAQITDGTTAESEKTNLRIVSGINSKDFAAAGYIISVSNSTPQYGASKSTVKELTYLYNSVNAGSKVYTASEIGGAYILALEIRDIPGASFGSEIYIRPYAVDADGVIHYGNTASLTVNSIIG